MLGCFDIILPRMACGKGATIGGYVFLEALSGRGGEARG